VEPQIFEGYHQKKIFATENVNSYNIHMEDISLKTDCIEAQ
jgi:Dullard-like phosphatase family protein